MSKAFQTRVERQPDGLHIIALFNGEPIRDYLIGAGPFGDYGFHSKHVYAYEIHNNRHFTRLHLSDAESRQIETAQIESNQNETLPYHSR